MPHSSPTSKVAQGYLLIGCAPAPTSFIFGQTQSWAAHWDRQNQMCPTSIRLVPQKKTKRMTQNVIITDIGFSTDEWTTPIIAGIDAAQNIEVEAIDVPSDSAPDQIFMPPHLLMIRIDFSNFADGRGFTLARLIRLLGFTGRLRAKGHVIADQYAMVRRSGFDEVEVTAELAKRQPEEQWLFRANLWKEHDYQARLRAH